MFSYIVHCCYLIFDFLYVNSDDQQMCPSSHLWFFNVFHLHSLSSLHFKLRWQRYCPERDIFLIFDQRPLSLNNDLPTGLFNYLTIWLCQVSELNEEGTIKDLNIKRKLLAIKEYELMRCSSKWRKNKSSEEITAAVSRFAITIKLVDVLIKMSC